MMEWISEGGWFEKFCQSDKGHEVSVLSMLRSRLHFNEMNRLILKFICVTYINRKQALNKRKLLYPITRGATRENVTFYLYIFRLVIIIDQAALIRNLFLNPQHLGERFSKTW